MRRRLYTLEEWNRQMRTAWEVARALDEPHPNGIACPQCGGELWDSAPDQVIRRDNAPPETPVHCPQCGWKWRRACA